MEGQKNSRYWEDVPIEGPIWRPKQLCQRLGISRSQTYQMIADGVMPPLIKLSERVSGMPDSWLKAFLEHRAEQTAQGRRPTALRKTP